jgi:two-component system, cell cycle response regulator DivK
MTILLIEDDKLTMKSVKFALNQHGHKVYLASTEPNALNQIRHHNDIEAIISDINLPGSPVITEMIADLKAAADVPVILISSVTDNPLIDDSLLTGAEAFLPKPLNFELLLDVVDRLSLRENMRSRR